MTLIVFMGILGLTLKVQRVKASGTIYIRVDGSVEPEGAPISSVDNVTYTLTGNITSDADGIVVERSNIIIDGNGCTLQGAGNGSGFRVNCINNVTIINTNTDDFYFGMFLNSSSFNMISGNKMAKNDYGILLNMSSFNIVSGNEITKNLRGIFLKYSCANNTLRGNKITVNDFGVVLFQSSNNTVSGNDVTDNNYDGIQLASSSNNMVSANNITSNNHYGTRFISLYNRTSNNKFCHNNFVNNTQQVYIDTPDYVNFWDNGVEGNYWTNYTGVDYNQDGIGDTSHIIDGNNTDHYPLMGIFRSFNTSKDCHVNVISNSTTSGVEYFESNSTIKMYVTSVTASQMYGFCRICIPYALMTAPYNVTVNGANPMYWNYTLSSNGTHGWIYFSYEHSTNKIIIVPEFPSFAVLPLIIFATLLTIIVYRRKHV